MKRVNIMAACRRKLLGALVVAGALSSGASMALPMPPAGSMLVMQYFATSDRNEVVGVRTYGGTCQNGPYPITWGAQTEYSSYYFYACEGEGGGGPIEY